MNIADKVVTKIPLETIWTDKGELFVKRISYLRAKDVAQLLKNATVQFVVADVGYNLKWIDASQCFDFWKKEAKQHIADNADEIDLESFVDNYAYVASQWEGQDETSIIMLEKFH
ncbi:hypothetical protein [Hymenobacter terricola]|uniref:hypothetical protein n=1 Tax=Hymenobacter terricola TaxID=2819236 RepID=UPI001B30D750|nr:hypothetical protein [Hymenobacter terricola]